LYFGSSERRLYGVYHPAGAARASRGVVLCYPFGREYLRAHRAVRELANELSRSGLHGLRFDYFGCGDSEGEASEGTLEEWVANVGMAVEEIEEATGSTDLSAVGLRLGATLAALSTAVPRARRLRSLALWDPIVVGARYLEELEALQRSWALEHPGFSATEDSSESPEILGFPLTPALRRALEGLDLRTLPRPAERILIVTGGEDRDAVELAEALAREGAEVTRAVVPSSKFWLRQEGIDHAVVPTETVRAISSWFDGAA
jgi:hypothetical protein